MNRIINPEQLEKPVGYAHAIEASRTGRTVYLAGHVSFDHLGNVVCRGDIVGQFNQTLANLRTCLDAAGGRMTDIVKMNIFTVDKAAYKANLRTIGNIYREYFGTHFPAMTFVEVKSLYDDGIMLEIEGIAVIEDK